MPINTIDLFAGCGGLSEGFLKNSDFNLCAFVDWNKKCCDTLKHNLKNKWKIKDAENRVLFFDIQKTKELLFGWEENPKYPQHKYSGKGISELEKNHGKIDLIIGGPPCQAYSIAGRVQDKNGMKDDYRNYLFESYIKIVDYFKPSAFVFENVPGMLSAVPGNRPVTERIIESFKKHNYEIIQPMQKFAVFNAAEYGVPQNRKRVILLGLRKDKFGGKITQALQDFYLDVMPTLKNKKIRTVKDAINDLPKFHPTDDERSPYKPKSSSIPNHFPRFHNKRDIKIFRELAYDIESKENKYESAKELKKLYTKRTGKTSALHKYYVLKWNKPSTTIVSHLHKDGLRHIHPDFHQARSITVREAARLQSFEDDYEFIGSQSDQYKMVGDAVPPLFSEAIAKGVSRVLSKYT